jgi:hypothetical protein
MHYCSEKEGVSDGKGDLVDFRLLKEQIRAELGDLKQPKVALEEVREKKRKE